MIRFRLILTYCNQLNFVNWWFSVLWYNTSWLANSLLFQFEKELSLRYVLTLTLVNFSATHYNLNRKYFDKIMLYMQYFPYHHKSFNLLLTIKLWKGLGSLLFANKFHTSDKFSELLKLVYHIPSENSQFLYKLGRCSELLHKSHHTHPPINNQCNVFYYYTEQNDNAERDEISENLWIMKWFWVCSFHIHDVLCVSLRS